MNKNVPQTNLNEKFYIIDNFLTSNKHILELGNNDWDSSKIFFQLSIEHAKNSPLTQEARKYKSKDKINWINLRNINIPKKLYLSAVLNRKEFFDLGGFSDIGLVVKFDENYLLICAVNNPYQNIILLVDAKTFEIKDEFNLNNKETIFKLEVVKNKLIILDTEHTLVMYDTQTKSILNLYNISDFKIIDEQKNIVAINKNGTFDVLDIENLEILEKYEGNEYQLKDLLIIANNFISWAKNPIINDDGSINEDFEEIENNDIEFDDKEIDYSINYDTSIKIFDRNSNNIEIIKNNKSFIKDVKVLNEIIIFYDEESYLRYYKKGKIIFEKQFYNIQEVKIYNEILIIVESDKISFIDINGKKLKSIKTSNNNFVNIDTDILKIISNDRAIIGSNDGKIYVIDLKKLKLITTFGYSFGSIYILKELLNGNIAAIDSHSNIVIYENYKPKTICDLQSIDDFIETDYGLIAYANAGIGLILINRINNFKTFDQDKILSPIFNSFDIENLLIFLSLDGEILIIEQSTKKILLKDKRYKGIPYYLKINQQKFMVYSGNKIDIYKNSEIIKSIEIYQDAEDSIAEIISHDDKFIIKPENYNSEYLVYILNEDLEKLANFEVEGTSDISLIKNTLIIGYEYGFVEFYNIDKKKFIRKLKIKDELAVENIYVVNEIIFIIDNEANILILDEKFKEQKIINFSEYSLYNSTADITLQYFNNHYLISGSFGTQIYNDKFKWVKNLEKLSIKTIVNETILFNKYQDFKSFVLYEDEIKVYSNKFIEIKSFNIEKEFDINPNYLYQLGLCLKNENVYYLKTDSSIISSNGSKWFYDGSISTEPFIVNHEIITEINGNIKFITLNKNINY